MPFPPLLASCRARVQQRVPFAAVVALALLTGCAVGPEYAGPPALAASAAAWQAPLPHEGRAEGLADWWSQFRDPTLTRLIDWAEADSPTLAQSWASIQKARATLAGTSAGGRPQISGTGSATRSRQQTSTQTSTQTGTQAGTQAGTQTIVSTVASAGLDASWELDLFGRVRRNAEAARARIEAREADWHEARISLAAEVADTYVQYRACGLLTQAYDRELASMATTESATAAMVRAGLSAPSDGALARASVASTRSTALRQRASCALLVKALVDLTGRDEPGLLAALRDDDRGLPQPAALRVASVPAQALRQRPDLAALERELAAASAEIGAAQADLYPSLSLVGSISRTAGIGGTGGTGGTGWSFGPQLSLPIFDGGQRRAAVDTAQASFAGALASYRQGVRSAVREVEEALVNLDSAQARAAAAREAATHYRRYLEAVDATWRAGSVSLTDLEAARRSALTAEIDELTLQQTQVSQWIALYKALGGGWSADAVLPATALHAQGGTP